MCFQSVQFPPVCDDEAEKRKNLAVSVGHLSGQLGVQGVGHCRVERLGQLLPLLPILRLQIER